MHSVPALRLHEGDRARLEALTRMSTAPAGLVRRARIVLLAAGGISNTEVAAQLRVSRPTVIKWRSRYADSGIAALGDLPRPGRPATVDEVAVLVATLADGARPPARLRAPYWSSRLLADELGIAHTTVSRVWRKWGYGRIAPRPSSCPPCHPCRPVSIEGSSVSFAQRRGTPWFCGRTSGRGAGPRSGSGPCWSTGPGPRPTAPRHRPPSCTSWTPSPRPTPTRGCTYS